jgi:hypothetical protein
MQSIQELDLYWGVYRREHSLHMAPAEEAHLHVFDELGACNCHPADVSDRFSDGLPSYLHYGNILTDN